MAAVLVFFKALFCLKIGWNLLTPYELARRGLRSDAPRTRGISFAPWIEVVLLALVLAAASVADEKHSFQSPKRLAFWGIVMIVVSYFHFVVGGAAAGWIVALIKRRPRGLEQGFATGLLKRRDRGLPEQCLHLIEEFEQDCQLRL